MMDTSKMDKAELIKLVEELNTENSEITDELISVAKELREAYDYCYVSTRLAYIAKYIIEEVLDKFSVNQLNEVLQHRIHIFATEMHQMISNISPNIEQEVNKKSGEVTTERKLH